MAYAPLSAWQFRLSKANDRVQWSWERLEGSHTVARSLGSLETLSDAFADARQHGFRDAHDKYTIV